MTLPERLRTLDTHCMRDKEAITEAAAIIERLPTTADGVTVSRGMTLFCISGISIQEFGPIVAAYDNTILFGYHGFHSCIDWKKVYATREAAEKARGM